MADYPLFESFQPYNESSWDMSKQYPVNSLDYAPSFGSINPADTWLDPFTASDTSSLPSRSSWDSSFTLSPQSTLFDPSATPLSPPSSLSTASPFPSPVLKTESSPEPVEQYRQPPPPPPAAARVPKRKKATSPTPRAGSKSAKSGPRERIPHNEVERKYREGLNQGMERLRRVLPNLPQANDRYSFDAAKVSKLVVLASAVDYLQDVEGRLARLQDENQRLREELAAERRR